MRREIRVDACIDHLHVDITGPRQRADAGTPGQIGRDHRGRDTGRIKRNALRGDAVIGREYEHRGVFGARRQRMPDRSELNREILQPAERAERLGLAIDPRPQLRFERRIDRLDPPVRQCSGRCLGIHSSSLRPTVEQAGFAVLRPVSWLTDDNPGSPSRSRFPQASVTSLIPGRSAYSCGGSRGFSGRCRITAFPFHLSRGTERRSHESMIQVTAQARTAWPIAGEIMSEAAEHIGRSGGRRRLRRACVPRLPRGAAARPCAWSSRRRSRCAAAMRGTPAISGLMHDQPEWYVPDVYGEDAFFKDLVRVTERRNR